MYLDQAKTRFSEIFRRTSFVPTSSSESEISEMEGRLNTSFPEAYREFLLWMGNGAGGFLGNFIFHTRSLYGIREDADELLEDELEKLSEDAIVIFGGSQGGYFKFIRASEGDNPPIHDFYEGDGFTWRQYPDLQSLVLDGIKWCVEHPEFLPNQKN
ncbi:SMI1/KNR4 family protein [Leptolyngbya sp. GGD]|uniref:SMI1/KNR4 family protein n=1 Tax=Leptolyngbya sp. GGD TaxID=2997907 RepID=UPI00227BAB24|nr:SMI1/KNR4 family protein [Leptolyngbya sp. GGD]MCY6490247.1 SMI1/KNR4 family protein [Leptolyngbya sp. GGD]